MHQHAVVMQQRGGLGGAEDHEDPEIGDEKHEEREGHHHRHDQAIPRTTLSDRSHGSLLNLQ